MSNVRSLTPKIFQFKKVFCSCIRSEVVVPTYNIAYDVTESVRIDLSLYFSNYFSNTYDYSLKSNQKRKTIIKHRL